MMLEQDIKEICETLAKKLREPEVPRKPTGNIIIFVQTGGVSGKIKLELML